jgi:hypothetical protein
MKQKDWLSPTLAIVPVILVPVTANGSSSLSSLSEEYTALVLVVVEEEEETEALAVDGATSAWEGSFWTTVVWFVAVADGVGCNNSWYRVSFWCRPSRGKFGRLDPTFFLNSGLS